MLQYEASLHEKHTRDKPDTIGYNLQHIHVYRSTWRRKLANSISRAAILAIIDLAKNSFKFFGF
jgi:hypothetical protein